MGTKNDKLIAMSNFVAKLNAVIIEDIAPNNHLFRNYGELSKIYDVAEKRKDFLVILEARKEVPNEVLAIAKTEGEKWSAFFEVDVEYR